MESEKAEEEDAAPQHYVASYNFIASGSDQLSFTSGDALLVHAKPSPEWWWAELRGVIGYVPATYLRQSGDGEEEDDPSAEDPWQDEEYFGSYSTLRLHLEMLSDKSRTETYRRAVLSNRVSLRNKAVLDLGCGTGIISLFCAQLAQPAVVYAVEASSMAEYTRQLVKQNGCEEVVTVLRGRGEDIELPEKVDVLVSEWMGNCLVFEFMVESVLSARDRWLREGGVMWPSSAVLTLVPCQAHDYFAEKMAFWECPYGLDFTPLQPLAQQEFFTKPRFSHVIQPSDCLASPSDVISLNMYTLQIKELEEITGQFHFPVKTSGTFHGFTAWFAVYFHSLEAGGTTVELNTGPNSEPTHWKQTLFMLDQPVSLNAGNFITGTIVLRRNPVWRRHMSVTLNWNINIGVDKCQRNKDFPDVEVTESVAEEVVVAYVIYQLLPLGVNEDVTKT